MGCQSTVQVGDNLVFSITTHDPDTGVLTDADSVPTYRVYEDETATAILTGSMAKLDDANTTGFYTEQIACTAANGFEVGKSYTVYITATVDSDTGGMSYAFVVEGNEAVVLSQPTTPYLCTRAAVKAALKIPASTTTLDDEVDACIVAASEWIELFCRQEFALSERTEYFSPGHEPTVMKNNTRLSLPFEVVSITSVHEDADRAYGSDTLIAATDYYLKGNVLYLYQDGTTVAFENGERTVKVVAQGGYSDIPQLLQKAATMLAVWIYGLGDRMRSNTASESVGGHTVSFKDEEMPKAVRAMLLSGGYVRQ